MIITSQMIANMRSRWKIDTNLEALLLKRLGTEPVPYTYTEQDLHEQVRKIVLQYNGDAVDGPLNSPDPGVPWSNGSTNNTGGQCPKNLRSGGEKTQR